MRKLIYILIFVLLSSFVYSNNYLTVVETFGTQNYSRPSNWCTSIGNYNRTYDNLLNAQEVSDTLDNTWTCTDGEGGSGFLLGNFTSGSTYNTKENIRMNRGNDAGASGNEESTINYFFNVTTNFDSNSEMSFYCRSMGVDSVTFLTFGNDEEVRFSLAINNRSAGSECGLADRPDQCCNFYNATGLNDLCSNTGSMQYVNFSFSEVPRICDSNTQGENITTYADMTDINYISIQQIGQDTTFIDDITILFFNGTNRLPEFNLSVPNIACINESTRIALVNISIDVFDEENDTIYYAYGVNVFDEGLFFTSFDINDCEELNIYNIVNDYAGIFKSSYNEMGNGIYSRYFDDVRRCVIELDNSTYNSTIGGTEFDKSIIFQILDIQPHEPDQLFKLQFLEVGTQLNLVWSNTLGNVFNRVNLTRNDSNSIRIDNLGEFSGEIPYDSTNFTQLKFVHANDMITVIYCDDFICNNENIVTYLNDSVASSRMKNIQLVIENKSVYLDDFIFSSEVVGNFTTTRPTQVQLEDINNHLIRVWVTDDIHLDESYNEDIAYISTYLDLSCYEGNLMDDVGIEFTNPNNLTGVNLLFAQLIWLLRLPYYLLLSFGLAGFYQLVGTLVLIITAGVLLAKGQIMDFTQLSWYLFLVGTLFQIMLAMILPVYIIIVLLWGGNIVQNFRGGE